MIVTKVYFTDLELNTSSLENRCHKGVIPLEWRRHRFMVPRDTIQYPVNQINRWLFKHMEGKWSIWVRTAKSDWEINIAFEKNIDAMTFVLSGGKTEALKNE